jgi:hypothetical protein
MKNQYFGDKRDYFKYSLLEALATGTPGVEQLTCIWMLTPNVRTNDGRKPFSPHPDCVRLTEFLLDCRAKGVADVREMRRYFGGQHYKYVPYGEDASHYVPKRDREPYFRGIPSSALQRSIVFFDPDNGLEPKGMATSAHLRYEELAGVFARMDAESVVVVYQHLPRVKASVFWPAVAGTLTERLKAPVGFVAESDLAFYIVPRKPARMAPIKRVFARQQARAGLLGPLRQVGYA